MKTEKRELCAECNGQTDCGRGAGVIIVKHGLVAVSRRLDHSNALQFAGGHVEAGESCVDGILRELREETGLEVGADRLRHLFHNIDAIGYIGKRYRACGFMIELRDDEELRNPEPHKHTDWRWVYTAFLFGEKMLPSAVRCLEASGLLEPSTMNPQP